MKRSTLQIILFFTIALGTQKSFSQTKTVTEVLTTVQNKMQDIKKLSCNLDYSLYPNYKTTKHSEQFMGTMLKYNETLYTKIHHTTFLNTPEVSLKVNEDERAMLLYEGNYNDILSQSPIEALNTFVKLFKTQTIKDLGNQWLCTLTTDVITQIPYGRVELYINKEDDSIDKQVIYFLAQLPYQDDKGNTLQGNPRLEIKLRDVSTTISEDEMRQTKLSNYIKYVGDNPIPVAAYKEFKLTKTN